MSIGARRLLRPGSSRIKTVVAAGANLNAIIAEGREGEVFVLTASPNQPYRITAPLALKSRQTLYSSTGATIKGSRIISAWTRDAVSGYWYSDISLRDHTNPTVQSNMTGYAYKTPGEVDHAQKLHDTFRDNIQLQRYMVRTNLRSGGFFHDYSVGRTWLADDPSGHTIEISTAEEAIHAYNTITSCVLDGVTFSHFACTPQMSAVYIEANGWIVRNCDFSYNHSQGLKLAYVTNGLIRNNTIHHNGQMGMGVYRCSGMTIEQNSLYENNYMGDFYALDWESGAIKFSNCTNCTFVNNSSHHNAGVGLWADIDNIGLVFEYNIIEDNESCGIRHEISFGARITGNIVRRNGYGATNGRWRTREPTTAGLGDYFARTGSPFMTAGININCSGGWTGDSLTTIEVNGNTVEYNQNGIFLQQRRRGYSVDFPTRPWNTQNVVVHHNTVVVNARPGDEWGDNLSGLGAYEEPIVGTRRDFFYNWGNVLHDNTYRVNDVSAVRFSGSDGISGWDRYDFATYQSRGHDLNSTCTAIL